MSEDRIFLTLWALGAGCVAVFAIGWINVLVFGTEEGNPEFGRYACALLVAAVLYRWRVRRGAKAGQQ